MAKKPQETVSLWAPLSPRDLGILCGLTVLMLLPLLNKAYHVDDPLFVWTAQQILNDPFNFYGFFTNWGRSQTYMYSIMQNPPLLSYFLAPFGAAFGWREPVMHFAMLLLSVFTCAGTYMAARRFCSRPFLAAVLAIVSPGFLVSASQVMSDIPMIGCWAWAVYFWMRGIDEDRIALTLTGAAFIAAGELTKYFAFSLVPLLLVYTLLAAPQRKQHLYCLLLPLVTLIGFEFLCNRLYGIGLLADATRFASEHRTESRANPVHKAQIALVFAGGALAATTLLIPWLWKRQHALAWGGLLLLVFAANYALPESRVMKTVLLINIENPGDEIVSSSSVNPTLLHQLQWALWTVGGLHCIVLALADIARRREPASVMLALWIAGTFFFVIMINHFVNARVILPMALAVALLAVRRLDDMEAPPAWRLTTQRAAWGVVGAALLMSVLLNYVDYRLAGSARRAATDIMEESEGRTVWFSGHSGWQYYMEARGGKAIDQQRSTPLPGDRYVLPSNNWQPIPVNASRVKTFEHKVYPVPRWATTSHYQSYAGFYSDGAGPLPFYFGPVPEEVYLVVDLGEIKELQSAP